jgi:prepilin-type N-terminal cleavage/methylation domain-containing protein
MKRNAGFTLIELLITITIMVILITLTVVSLRGNQVNARDEERETDVTSIAQNLESFYRSGSDDPTAALAHTNQYPPTSYMNSEAKIKAALRDIDPRVLRAPGVGDSDPISLTVATSTSAPTPDTDAYIYQPLKSDGSLCQLQTDECRKFSIFYQQEADTSTQEVASKHQ